MSDEVSELFSHSAEPSAAGATGALPAALQFSHPTMEAPNGPGAHPAASAGRLFSHPRGAEGARGGEFDSGPESTGSRDGRHRRTSGGDRSGRANGTAQSKDGRRRDPGRGTRSRGTDG
ncbi:hypothetical protein Apa02nite_062770 [Actinoplanes palleronii]|uniref:Uncharacterized protein n=1 Tax=Actinoplanes palleronii TaxID=113570 RepID=A0ABQ4BHN5_9ACTN|nr:hypothetical protein Apa02nite_062770 [Actinoplanes palleronii]